MKSDIVAFINPDSDTDTSVLTIYSVSSGDCVAYIPNPFKRKTSTRECDSCLRLIENTSYNTDDTNSADAVTEYRQRYYYIVYRDHSDVILVKPYFKSY